MKQKIVIKVHMPCGKCRKEAMKIAACEDGVISVTLQGNDKDQIVVVGHEVDSAGLCTTLRKKVGTAKLVSVEEVKDPKPEEKKKEEPKKTEEKKPEENKPEENKPKEENKKQKNKNNEKKKDEECKKSCCAPGMYYNCPCSCPPPQYHCPTNNPQFYMCTTLPVDDNPGCNIM